MLLGILLLALVAFRRPESSEGAGGDSDPSPSARSGLDYLRELGDAAGMTPEQVDFLAFVAYGESGLKPNVGLGIPEMFPAGTKPNTRASQAAQAREARAAANAYEANTGWLGSCGYPASAYSFGSGGLFAFLPTYALAQFKGTPLACANPAMVFDAAFAMAAAYGFARSLTQRSGYLGTYGSLRSGWGLPSKIGDRDRIASKAAKWNGHLKALGLNRTVESQAPAFPRRDLVLMFEAMEAAK